jgi:hypothetical protein
MPEEAGSMQEDGISMLEDASRFMV